MAHLSEEIQHRFLARLLSPEETLYVIKHLRECDDCRERLLAVRSTKASSLVDSILPEKPEEEHPSADSLGAYLDDDLAGPDKTDLEEHLRTCELCQNALTDLKSFREELLQAPPQEYVPVANSVRSGQTRFGSRWFSQETARFLKWFNRPLVYAGVAAVAALIVVFGVVVRSPETFGIAGNGQVTVAEGSRRIELGPNGITNAPAGLPSEVLTALNNVAAPILKDQPPSLSVTLKDNLAVLKRAPSVLLGQPSAAVSFQVLSPFRTLVESVRPTFKWATATGATSYVVHVIGDDRTQEEVATSPVILPTASDATSCQWTPPGSTSLSPGKRYRWYVTATIKNQEVDAPGIEQAQAKFAVLCETELANLNALRKSAQGDRLIDGLLDLNEGLLDAAESDFEYLLADPAQTANAKAFLKRMITEIGRLKQT
jgi:anti-sigma factor RsiW